MRPGCNGTCVTRDPMCPSYEDCYLSILNVSGHLKPVRSVQKSIAASSWGPSGQMACYQFAEGFYWRLAINKACITICRVETATGYAASATCIPDVTLVSVGHGTEAPHRVTHCVWAPQGETQHATPFPKTRQWSAERPRGCVWPGGQHMQSTA